METGSQKTWDDPAPIREAPVMLEALPAQAKSQRKNEPGESSPGSFFSPQIPAQKYAALLEAFGKGNTRGLNRNQLIKNLRTSYGNRFIMETLTGYQDKNKEISEKEETGKKKLPPLKEIPKKESPLKKETTPKVTKEPAQEKIINLKKEESTSNETPEEKAAPPPSPSGLGPAATFLITAGAKTFKEKVQKIKKLGKNEKTHKTAAEKTKETKKAVVPPEQEAQSRANAEQVNIVSERPEPQTDEQAAKQTLDIALENATPRTIEDVDNFKNESKTREIRSSVLATIKSQTAKVQQTYQDIGDTSKAETISNDSTPIPSPEAAPITDPLQMGKKLLPTLPAEQTDLSEYQKEADSQIAREEINPKDLDQVDSGPLSEANALRSQIKEDVQSGTSDLKKNEQEQHTMIDQELAADEKSARGNMTNQRQGQLSNVKGTQDAAKKKEEDKRRKVTEDIQKIYQKAKDSVEKKLAGLETDSLNQFDQGQEKASAKFENTVSDKINAYKKERYSGPLGWTLKAKDWLLDMDELPRVKQIFTDARNAFIGEIDTLIKTIIAGSKKTIAECKAEIQAAKDRITEYVKSLGPELKNFAAQAQKEMTAKLDALDQQVNDKEKELQKKLEQRREKAIKTIDEKIERMKEKLKGALSKHGSLLADAALKLFKWALEKAGAPVDKVMGFLKNAGAAFLNIIKSPGTFLGNLIDALMGGFKKFYGNIQTHLKNGLMQWLFGALADAGITMPSEFSLKAIFGMVLQILGLTPSAIKMKVTQYIGEKNMERIEKVWEFISALISGGLGGLWEQIKEYFTNLKEMVLDGIKDWVITTIIKEAVQWLLSLFNPAGAIIKIAMTIYKIVMFIIERIQQITAVAEAIIGSLSEIASGAIAKAINWVEKTLARLVPVAIGFLAALLGLGGISTTIRKIIDKARKPVHNALDKVIAKIASGIKTGSGKVAGKVGQWWKARKQFTTRGGETHTLFFEGSGKSARLMIKSEKKTFSDFTNQIEKSGNVTEDKDKKKAFNTAKKIAQDINNLKIKTETAGGTKDQTPEFTKLLNDLGEAAKILSGAGVYSEPKTDLYEKLIGTEKPLFDGTTREAHHAPHYELANLLASKVKEFALFIVQYPETIKNNDFYRTIDKKELDANRDSIDQGINSLAKTCKPTKDWTESLNNAAVEFERVGRGKLPAILIHAQTHRKKGGEGYRIHGTEIREPLEKKMEAEGVDPKTAIITKISKKLSVNPRSTTYNRFFKSVADEVAREAKQEFKYALLKHSPKVIKEAYRRASIQQLSQVKVALDESKIDGDTDKKNIAFSKLKGLAKEVWEDQILGQIMK